MFYGFGEDGTEALSLEEIIKQSCPPPEEKPVEEKKPLLAGFPVWAWLLVGGVLLTTFSKGKKGGAVKHG